MKLPHSFLKGIKRGTPLRDLTTFRIGGPAQAFVEPADAGELACLLKQCGAAGIPVRVIGAGSNILASDKGVAGILVRLSAPFFRSVRARGNRIECGAGLALPALLRLCRARGLTGAEFLAGIPGSVGGALAMNCGVAGGGAARSIGDIVEQVTVARYNGVSRVIDGARAGFGYRRSGLSRYVIISAVFKLRKSTGALVGRRLREWMDKRRGQEYRYPSAGCVFKNPRGRSAGALIDACGLKGARAGGAMISEKHANFIVNTGRASCADVLSLMRRARRAVKRKYGIALEQEIKLWK